MEQIQSNQLENWTLLPGNYKYYGTEGTWAKAFQDLNTSVAALWFINTSWWLVAPWTNYILISNDANKASSSATVNGIFANAVLLKEIKVNKTFLYNITCTWVSNSGVNGVVFRVYVNWSTVLTTTGNIFGIPTVFTTQYYGVVNDLIQVYYWNKTSWTPTATISNFRLLATPVESPTGIATNTIT